MPLAHCGCDNIDTASSNDPVDHREKGNSDSIENSSLMANNKGNQEDIDNYVV
jgi:hypothetical protein